MKRGRPCTYDKNIIIAAIESRKSEVLTEHKKIVSRHDQVWKVISDELENVISPHGLFTFVTNNRYNIKDCIIPPSSSSPEVAVPDVPINESANISDSSTASVNEENDEQLVDITFDKAELELLVVKKQYSRSEKKRPQIAFREYLVLQPGKWQAAVTTKLWEACKKKCGFQFKRNKIYNNKLEILGKCECGSVIKGSIERLNLSAESNVMRCAITCGDGTCGKRYLREPIRSEVGKMLYDTNKTAEVYRAEEANRLMSPNDPEPSHLYKAEALRKAKEKYQESLTLHKNPVMSILLAKLSSLKYSIHNISLSPFHVHYWSSFQTNVYKQYSLSEPSSVAIDATGSIVRKLVHPDGSKSHHIFLYTCVVNSRNSQTFPVTQMLSECHTTVSIWYWLMEWTRTGAPPPKEVTCDASKALLLAATRAFTAFTSIDEYARRCWATCEMPVCYIRIDVAHFMNTYAKFLKVAINPKIKTFYLAAMGQLILSRTIYEAEKILVGILTIARSKTEGLLEDGQPSACEAQKNILIDILKDSVSDTNVSEDSEQHIANESLLEDTGSEDNPWHDWALRVSDKISSASCDMGNRVNAHYLPEFADRLTKDMKWFPLWSCVCVDQFGYGKIPASSASVESEFNNVKTRLLSNVILPIRADVFLNKHAEYISGRLKIINAKMQESNNTTAKPLEIDSFMDENLVSQSVSTECPACAMGDEPTGAHTCAMCGVFVHALDACSKAMSNEAEGFGQKRLCGSCSKIPDKAATDIINSNEQENWRGLSEQPPKKKSRYLKTSFTQNEFLLHGKIKQVPILKNGSSLTLQATNLKGRKITLTNTCAFDSIYQIFLTAAFDSADFKTECCNLAERSRFFKIIKDSANKGITKNTYYLRAEVLVALFPADSGYHDTLEVKCEVTISHLCQRLFEDTPSLTEISSCDEGCPSRVKPLPKVPVSASCLIADDFNKAVEDNFMLSGASHCCQKNCVGIETTAPPTIGSFIICDIYNVEDPDGTTKLSSIPSEIQLSFMPQPYMLRGVVHWVPPPAQTRRSDPEHHAIGHYSAISYRPDGTWVQYDDTVPQRGKKVAGNFPARVQIIVYTI